MVSRRSLDRLGWLRASFCPMTRGMRGVRGPCAVVLVSLALVPACKSKDASARDAGPLAGNPVPHLITKDQCTTWSGHGVEVIFNDRRRRRNLALVLF